METKINEVCDRSKLSEGRDQGMAFAWLLPKDNNVYDTVFHMSPCKDFLNEPLFTENTGLETYAYGLRCKEPIGIFKDNCGYLGITILKKNSDGYNITKDGYEAHLSLLNDNYSNIQKFLNNFESMLNIENQTVIEKANDNFYLVKVPKEFTTSTINISLYTLLLRVSIKYDGKEDIIEYLSKYDYIGDDKYLIKDMLPRLKIIIENKKLIRQPEFNEDKIKKGYWSPHNIGILSWNMKYDEELVAVGVD